MAELAALSLAANVLQVIGFAGSVICKSWEYYNSNAEVLDENKDAALVAGNLRGLCLRLQGPLVDNDQVLVDLAHRTAKSATELSEQLEKLAIKGKRSKAESLRKGLKAVWGKDKLESLATRLTDLRAELNLYLTVDLKAMVRSLNDGNKHLLLDLKASSQDGVQQILAALENQQDAFTMKLDGQLQMIHDTHQLLEWRFGSKIDDAYALQLALLERSERNILDASQASSSSITRAVHSAAESQHARVQTETALVRDLVHREAAQIKLTTETNQQLIVDRIEGLERNLVQIVYEIDRRTQALEDLVSSIDRAKDADDRDLLRRQGNSLNSMLISLRELFASLKAILYPLWVHAEKVFGIPLDNSLVLEALQDESDSSRSTAEALTRIRELIRASPYRYPVFTLRWRAHVFGIPVVNYSGRFELFQDRKKRSSSTAEALYPMTWLVQTTSHSSPDHSQAKLIQQYYTYYYKPFLKHLCQSDTSDFAQQWTDRLKAVIGDKTLGLPMTSLQAAVLSLAESGNGLVWSLAAITTLVHCLLPEIEEEETELWALLAELSGAMRNAISNGGDWLGWSTFPYALLKEWTSSTTLWKRLIEDQKSWIWLSRLSGMDDAFEDLLNTDLSKALTYSLKNVKYWLTHLLFNFAKSPRPWRIALSHDGPPDFDNTGSWRWAELITSYNVELLIVHAHNPCLEYALRALYSVGYEFSILGMSPDEMNGPWGDTFSINWASLILRYVQLGFTDPRLMPLYLRLRTVAFQPPRWWKTTGWERQFERWSEKLPDLLATRNYYDDIVRRLDGLSPEEVVDLRAAWHDYLREWLFDIWQHDDTGVDE